MTTVFTYAPALEHDLAGHPENARRGPAVMSLIDKIGLTSDLSILAPQPAAAETLRAVHARPMLAYIEEISLRGGGRVDQDTYATDASFGLAQLAAGSTCRAAGAVAQGEAENGYVFVRPPGHHAEFQRPGGFCLVNNAAAAARFLQQTEKIGRVAIIDFDVHHGNGTQDIFYDDPSVLFISSHQYGRFFYPGSGAASEIGSGPGEGATMNIPLIPGMGDRVIAALYRELVWPKLAEFKPEFILVSAGYDAHWSDPLANINVSLTGFAHLVQTLVSWSRLICNGKIVFVQEGGYVLEALAHGVVNTLYACLGRDAIVDPLGQVNAEEPDPSSLMTTVRGLHLI